MALVVANRSFCLLTIPSFQKKAAMLFLLVSIFLLPTALTERPHCLCDFSPIISGEVTIRANARTFSVTVNFTANYNLSRVHMVPKTPGSTSFKRIVLNLESGEVYQELNNGSCTTRIVYGLLFPECVPLNYSVTYSAQNVHAYRKTHPSGIRDGLFIVTTSSDGHCVPNVVAQYTPGDQDALRVWKFKGLSFDSDKTIDFNPNTDKCLLLPPVSA